VTEPSAAQVTDNAAARRFELDVDGHIATAFYELSPGVITFTHTEVPKQLGGRGIGSILAKGALDMARARGLKVVAQCPFIESYVGKHPEYRDLL
jgi:predicted GNAT family acetyltransferase